MIINQDPRNRKKYGVGYDTFNGAPIPPTDGGTLRGVLDNNTRPQQEFFFEHRCNCAILSGHWRLVKNATDKQWNLFDLESDPFEQTNIAARHPD